jgi:hypothetical protein
MGYASNDNLENLDDKISTIIGEVNLKNLDDGNLLTIYNNKIPDSEEGSGELPNQETCRLPEKWNEILMRLKGDGAELIRNSIKNRVCVSSYNANNPSEDVYNAIQLRNITGYYLTVLDGHGGVDVANIANERLHVLFDKYMKQVADDSDDLPLEKVIEDVINKVYNQVENEIYQKALTDWKRGDGRLAFMGTCALTVIVIDDSLYIANLGDSKAKLFRRRVDSDNYEAVKISKTYNANKLKERERLVGKFTTDKDIVIGNERGVWYVKGRLAPTRVSVYLQ